MDAQQCSEDIVQDCGDQPTKKNVLGSWIEVVFWCATGRKETFLFFNPNGYFIFRARRRHWGGGADSIATRLSAPYLPLKLTVAYGIQCLSRDQRRGRSRRRRRKKTMQLVNKAHTRMPSK